MGTNCGTLIEGVEEGDAWASSTFGYKHSSVTDQLLSTHQ